MLLIFDLKIVYNFKLNQYGLRSRRPLRCVLGSVQQPTKSALSGAHSVGQKTTEVPKETSLLELA